jgi:phage/plasmid-associated DNA primase
MGNTEGSDKCTKGRRNLKHIQKQHDEGVTDVEPGLMCYKWALYAWTRSSDPSAFLKAEAILRQAQHQTIQPNPELIAPIAAACAQSTHPNAALKAEALLQEISL